MATCLDELTDDGCLIIGQDQEMPREMWGQRQTRERCRKIGNKEKCVQCLANELSLYLFSSLFSFMVKGREGTGLLSSHRSGPHSQGQQPTNPPL